LKARLLIAWDGHSFFFPNDRNYHIGQKDSNAIAVDTCDSLFELFTLLFQVGRIDVLQVGSCKEAWTTNADPADEEKEEIVTSAVFRVVVVPDILHKGFEGHEEQCDDCEKTEDFEWVHCFPL
jgi:hypothetical protein